MCLARMFGAAMSGASALRDDLVGASDASR
jgi:hypothetical protein